jgi:hypothetical protein
MSIEQNGSLAFKLNFNGTDLPLGRILDIESFHTSCSTRTSIPTVHLKLVDISDYLLTNNLLFDGCPIGVVIGVPGLPTSTYNFRLNSFRPIPGADNRRTIELDGYLDCPEYWNTSSYTLLKGTSAAVLSTIASQCKLSYQGTATADTQVWYPRNQYYHEWANSIAEHGYKSDSSGMQLGLDLSSTLVYADVSSLDNPKFKIAIGELKQDYLFASEAKFTTKSGSLNHYSGFASGIVNQKLLSSGVTSINSTLKLHGQSTSTSVLMNKDLKARTTQGRLAFTPLDPGNAHTNFELAKYQNRRIANLFTTRAEVILTGPSGVKLLDCVQIILDNPNREALGKYSGNYRVSSRVVYTNGSQYFEKLELVSKSASLTTKDQVSG